MPLSKPAGRGARAGAEADRRRRMSLFETLYSAMVSVLRPVLPAFRAASPKVSAAVEGRRAAAGEIARWASAGRDPARPLLWVHGASAGELAGSIPVVRLAREAHPGLQLLVTYSSPSATSVVQDLAPDYAGYPPLETAADCRLALAGARPSAVIFAKLDVWPGLTRAAAEAGVPIGMINASVRPSSTRLRGPGRRLLIPSYRRMTAVGAVSEDEVDRLVMLGASRQAIVVTGDSSLEQSLDRVDRARAAGRGASHLPSPAAGVVRLVAGSTWPEDERVLLEAAARLPELSSSEPAQPAPRLELVLVPHEPDDAAIGRIRSLCLELLGVEPRLWSRPVDAGRESAPRAPLVVDAVGFLAELYLECDLAWVGGGVGGEGLHSVAEPAAAGIPVLFGPVHDRWEARELVVRGAARIAPPEAAAGILVDLMADASLRRQIGSAARAFVESGRGAAAASARLISRLMVPPG